MSRWFTDYRMGAASLNKSDASVVCLGNFDGVHRGHQAILACAKEEAKRRHHKSILFTFSPHPSKILRAGEGGVALLNNSAEKRYLLNQFAFDIVIEQNFDRDFTLISAETFASEVLLRDLHASAVVVGENFHFGYQAKGTSTFLESLHLFDVFGAEAVKDSSGAIISSSRIRQAVGSGRFEEVEALLGYPYFVSGRIVHGDGRGKGLGFPTMNLQFEKECVPPFGVYAAFVGFSDDLSKIFPAAVNWGVRPTVGGSVPSLEAHLIDMTRDAYGEEIHIFFKSRIRNEMKFSSLQELKDRVAQDIADVRKALQGKSASLKMQS